MTILAGLSPVGALIVRAGEPKVLNISLAQADGTTPQNLQGRTFALIVRRSSRPAPLFTIPAELSPDGLYVSVMMTAEQATAIYEAGYAQALSYDIVELTGGASTSRFTERVQVQVGPDLPSDIVPIWSMLPYTEAMIRPDALVITERGAAGESRLLDYPVDPDELPVSTATEDALPYGPLTSGVWKRFTGWLRVRLTGTGNVIIDARNALGEITQIVPQMAVASATNTVIYPFPGADATSIRATLTGSATAEIV